jgi:hypothetical protein
VELYRGYDKSELRTLRSGVVNFTGYLEFLMSTVERMLYGCEPG